MSTIQIWKDATKETNIKLSNGKRIKQNAFRLTNGGMTKNQLENSIEKMLQKSWEKGRRGEYKLTVLYENAGFRTCPAVKLRKNNIIVEVTDTTDSNISEEEAGKIIAFYLYDTV